jgi:probable rRNA maturation factor
MTQNIHFFTEDLEFLIKSKKQIRDWITNIATEEKTIAGDINFIFCSDAYLMKINKKYLKHNSYTDIITFPLMDDNSVISGDIYISIPRVRENAKLFRQKVSDEVHRVIVHGVLHLLGYDDSTHDEKKVMRNKEDYYLGKLTDH